MFPYIYLIYSRQSTLRTYNRAVTIDKDELLQFDGTNISRLLHSGRDGDIQAWVYRICCDKNVPQRYFIPPQLVKRIYYKNFKKCTFCL